MAKYAASAGYSVLIDEVKTVKFNVVGEYETEDGGEIAVLDSLCPIWIIRVDKPEETEKAPAAPRKASAK